MKKPPTVPRVRQQSPSKTAQLVECTANQWMHQNSAVISSKMRMMQFEAEEIDRSITALTAALTSAKHRLAEVNATLQGLNLVMSKRTLHHV